MNTVSLEKYIREGGLDETLATLYGKENTERQRERYLRVVAAFGAEYGSDREVSIFSVPGRSEISGNHTDHNHGCVIAAAIDLDIIAVAAQSDERRIRIHSEGFPEDVVELEGICAENAGKYASGAIIAGVCDGFVRAGHAICGYDAYTTSNVFKGSGLSSSAAFEDMVGNILNHFSNGGTVSAPEIAKISQYAENEFFGKPCGLMDQTACSVGGFVAIDFADPKNPVIEKLDFDLTAAGYTLCIVNTGGNHADLNEDYASVPSEMKAVAKQLGHEVLRDVTRDELLRAVPALRQSVGDRAILRAMHFIGENERVRAQSAALRAGDVDGFLDGVRASGDSSFKWLQNVYTTINVKEQGLSLALCIAETLFRGYEKRAVARVHGGGFAGTVQAFVPTENVPAFRTAMDAVFGDGATSPLRVRAEGAIRVL